MRSKFGACKPLTFRSLINNFFSVSGKWHERVYDETCPKRSGTWRPPKHYTNNDPESANFIIKHGLNFNAEKPHELIDKIKNIIETQ